MTIPGLWQHALEYQQARGQKAIKCKQFDDGLERGAFGPCVKMIVISHVTRGGAIAKDYESYRMCGNYHYLLQQNALLNDILSQSIEHGLRGYQFFRTSRAHPPS